MDIPRLQAIARDLMDIPDMADDFRYFVGSFAVMLSDDPLTLDAAVKVIGLEPGCVHRSSYRTRYDWGDTISVRTATETGRANLRFGGNDYENPTIGQFACLVAAARMGEKA